MSLFDISSWFTGQNETARGQAADAELAAINNNSYAPPSASNPNGGATYNTILTTQGKAAADAAWAQVQVNLAADQADTASYNGQVADAAAQGAAQGLNDLGQGVADAVSKGSQAVNNTLWFAIKNFFGAIPITGWLLIGVGLFIWIGGLGYIRGILPEHKRKP